MKNVTMKTKEFTKVDLFNANNARPIKDFAGECVEVYALAFGEDVMADTGEVKKMCALKTNAGIITTISETVMRAAEDLVPIIDEDGTVSINIEARTSGKGREFFVLTLNQ